ncbi:MAG: PBSX family phage terminase large subunit [Lachnospiraceae bacterium]|nr:PBSX family phage terminase large subunit [Lachnospiraceae bacterium]
MTNDAIRINLPSVVGRGYRDFWNFRGRYRVVKGSRASKKSKTAALWFIYNMMKYQEANTLVIRKTFRTLKDSCFTELKWAVHRLQVDRLWRFTESPLEATYLPTGQKIYFRGLDDPLKVTSITVDVGSLCWMWIEESYEIMRESDFEMLDESIRGAAPEGLFKQITFTFNPWNEKHWIKHRFFDEVTGHDSEGKPIYTPREAPISADGEIMAITTNYTCNEWLDSADLRVFQRMKENNPRRYKVAGLGDWGVVEGLVFENWTEQGFELINRKDYLQLDEAAKKKTLYVVREDVKSVFGLDFGYTNDPTALFAGFIDLKNRKIYVWDELYETGLSNRKIFERITAMGYGKERITADSAEPKSIDELKAYGLHVKGAKKGKDSVNNGIQFIQDFEIIVHPRCVNYMTEISNYTWMLDKFGNKLNVPIDDFNHLMDAMRYAVEQYISGKGWMY